MNAVMRWDPFRELEEMSERLNRVFNRPAARSTDGKETITVADWIPTVDIAETDVEYQIKAELPEVKKDDVRVTVENGVLSISGERKVEKEEKDKKYHRVERAYGRFERSFELLSLASMTVEKQAAEPAHLSVFYRWQDAAWKQQTVSLR